MSDYLDSSLYVLEMYFFNQNKQACSAHISRKKAGVGNPFAFPALRNDSKVGLRALIENTVSRTGVKKLDLTDRQYEMLEKVDIYYQTLETRGFGYMLHCHWSVFEGLSVCELMLDEDYTREKAVYFSSDCINGSMLNVSRSMIKEDLTSCETDIVRGKRCVMIAEDYLPEQAQGRYHAYMDQAKRDWNERFSSCFVPFDNDDLNKKSVVLSTKFTKFIGKYSAIERALMHRGAVVKDSIGKKTDYLMVDTENIEKLDCFAERLWRLQEGDEKTASKIAKPLIERAVALNESGSHIRIVRLQDALESLGLDYNNL